MDEMTSGFWLVTVITETENAKGKIKKNTERYLVENCGSAKDAETRALDKMNGALVDNYYVKSVVRQKLDGII
jgi:hypothetical protein